MDYLTNFAQKIKSAFSNWTKINYFCVVDNKQIVFSYNCGKTNQFSVSAIPTSNTFIIKENGSILSNNKELIYDNTNRTLQQSLEVLFALVMKDVIKWKDISFSEELNLNTLLENRAGRIIYLEVVSLLNDSTKYVVDVYYSCTLTSPDTSKLAAKDIKPGEIYNFSGYMNKERSNYLTGPYRVLSVKDNFESINRVLPKEFVLKCKGSTQSGPVIGGTTMVNSTKVFSLKDNIIKYAYELNKGEIFRMVTPDNDLPTFEFDSIVV